MTLYWFLIDHAAHFAAAALILALIVTPVAAVACDWGRPRKKKAR